MMLGVLVAFGLAIWGFMVSSRRWLQMLGKLVVYARPRLVGPARRGPNKFKNTTGSTLCPRHPPAAGRVWPGSRSSSLLAGVLVAASDPLSQPSRPESDHPVKWLIGLLAILALGWLGWLMSRFGRDTATEAGTLGDVGSTHTRAHLGRFHGAPQPADGTVGGQRQRFRARSSETIRATGTQGSSLEPVGPEDDQRFMRQVSEQLEHERAERERTERQRNQDDGTDAGRAG